MKSIFTAFKIFSFGFFVFFAIYSCKSYLVVNGGAHVPKKVCIHVTAYDTSGPLILMDDSSNHADTFRAWPGQQIKWKLDDPRHHAIDSLSPKPTSKNEIFDIDPHKVFLSKSWKGIVKNQAAIQADTVKDFYGFHNYDYKIIWDSGGSQHTFDPRIQIK